MPVLHMDTEAVRSVGSQLNQSAESLRLQNQQLRSITSRLTGEWDGGSADMFESEMQTLLQRMGQSAETGISLHKRLEQEVQQWLDVGSRLGTSFLPNDINLIPNAVINELPGTLIGSSFGTIISYIREHATLKVEGSIYEFDKYTNKGDYEPKLGIKYGIDGALYGDPNKDGFSFLGGEIGAGAYVGSKGFTAGIYGEGYAVKGQADGVLGSENLGLTGGIEGKALGVDGFLGIKDNSIGASIGGTLVSVQGEVGTNIAGANVGLKGEIGLKAELGFKVGQDTEIKLPFVTIGFTFGKAKRD